MKAQTPQALAREVADRYFAALAADLPYDTAQEISRCSPRR